MGNNHYYENIGFALELLAQSIYHKQKNISDYFRVEVLPAIWKNQARFYVTKDGIPRAMVTWAWLSEAIEEEVHATGRALALHEWECGNRLFFNDWVTPYGNIQEVLRDMTCNLFPNEIATSLRRNQDGSVRRINRWTGANIRRFDKRAVM